MIQKIGKDRAKLIVSTSSGKTRKRRTKIVTYTGKRDLERQYREFEDEVKRKPYTKITVSELVSSYIRYKKTLGIKATTLHGYNCDKRRIDNQLGSMTATKVTAYMVEDFISDMAETLKPKSILNTISLLNASYERAVRTGQIADNPCKHVALPKKSAPEIITFSQDEVVKFWDALSKERLDYKVGYGLCLLCGLRRSEVLGLREEDINLTFKVVSVHSTRHRVDGVNDIIQDTKTAKSRRVLAIPDVLIPDIEKLIDQHRRFIYDHTDYLIQDGFGQPMSPSTFSKRVLVIEEREGLPRVTVHGLRHTFASMLNSAGIDIARISTELGHSNIGTTLNVYTHVFGNVSASSRGIADAVSSRLEATKEPEHVEKSATFLPLKEIKRA